MKFIISPSTDNKYIETDLMCVWLYATMYVFMERTKKTALVADAGDRTCNQIH